jgi:hypothetical protein
MSDQAWPAGPAGAAGATEVPRFRERIGVSGLVDMHTHSMPERVLRKVWAYFDALGPLTGGVEWPIACRAEERQRIGRLRQSGVRAFTAMLHPHRPGMARWLNGWAAGFAPDAPRSGFLRVPQVPPVRRL